MFWKTSPDSFPLIFESCGKFVSRGEWIHPCRIISSYEIIAVLSGKISLYEGEKEFVLEKNQVYLLSPHIKHGGTRPSRDVSFYWLHFQTQALFNEKHFFFSDADTSGLFSLFRMLLHDVNTPFYPQTSAEYLTRLILNEISYLSDRKKEENHIAYKVAEYISGNITDRPNVTDVAEHFGYHPDYLSRLFRKTYGRGIGVFIAEQTIKNAKTLLSVPEKSISEIARILGFENANAFTKFFQYHEGITPSRYVSLYYNTHINHS